MWSRRLLSAVVLRPLAWALIRTHVSGMENVSANGPFILMVNHCNFLDPAAAIVTMLPREVVIFTKAQNLDLPVGGLLLRWYGAVPVERGEADVQAMRRAIDVLTREQNILLVAPEGTRSYHGRLLPAKPGMAFIAAKTGVPVLPVGVTGVKGFWSNVRQLRRTHVQVRIGHPFRFRNPGRVRKDTLDAMTREAMYQLAALLPPEQWGEYSDMENATENYLEFVAPGCSNLVRIAKRSLSGDRAVSQRLVGAVE